jgi:hypothetical protein
MFQRQGYTQPARTNEEANRRNRMDATMGADILADLKSWLAQLVADAPHRHGHLPEIEINYVRRAIEEIERLRAAEKANRSRGMAVSMQIPAEWLAEVGLQNFKPVRSSIRCAGPHTLIALGGIERLVRDIPIDSNGFRRSKMMPVLELIRDDRPFDFQSTLRVRRANGRIVCAMEYIVTMLHSRSALRTCQRI